MIQSLRSEAKKSEDMFVQLQEIQESVRLAFLNCFLDFAGTIAGPTSWFYAYGGKDPVNYGSFILCHWLGHLEHIATELAQNRASKESQHLQNGYYDDSEEKVSSDVPGSVIDSHQQLLIVLSNIGYCKDELSHELFNKYKSVWLQSR